MGMSVSVTTPDGLEVVVGVSGKYSTDILDDIQARATRMLKEAVANWYEHAAAADD